MRLLDLNPELKGDNLYLDCPGGCGQRMIVPRANDTCNWTFHNEDLATLTVTPSVNITYHSHFTITNGEIIDHKDVTDKYKEG